ncbi:MAG: hypothetical protein GEU88_05270 [Solirubrobacterales bacterium]|nr:hypothetical protein [Solirubrobacterales bacterium]
MNAMEALVNRLRHWMRSDLIGVPVPLLAAGVALVSILAIYLGPVRGIVFSAPVWGAGLYLAIRGARELPDIADIRMRPEGARHRILVVADRGLENPALCDAVCRRADRAATDVMVLAPVVASSRLGILTDDFDAEARRARERVEQALCMLRDRGVRATGHVDQDAEPISALVDGLRWFSADEVVMLAGAEPGWDRAGALAERVRREVGVPVVEVRG